MIFGHLGEIFLLVVVGLLVFGPRKMIEIAQMLGKLAREVRAATKDLDFSDMLHGDFTTANTPPQYTPPTQATPTEGYSAPTASTAPVTEPAVVESTIEPTTTTLTDTPAV